MADWFLSLEESDKVKHDGYTNMASLWSDIHLSLRILHIVIILLMFNWNSWILSGTRKSYICDVEYLAWKFNVHEMDLDYTLTKQ